MPKDKPDLNAVLKMRPNEIQAIIPSLNLGILHQLTHDSIEQHPVVRQAAIAELHRRDRRRQLILILASLITAASTAATAIVALVTGGVPERL